MNDGRRDTAAELARACRRADRELELAARAGGAAARAELASYQGAAFLRGEGARIAVIFRGTQQRHLAAARLHAAHAARLRQRLEAPRGAQPPAFAAAVADVSRGNRVVLVLSGHQQPEALVAASDPVARAAYELEAAYGEGPARDAIARRAPVRVYGRLGTVWPEYGPAVGELGVHAVGAAPLRLRDRLLGSITAMNPAGHSAGLPVGRLADTLVSVLLAGDIAADGDGLPTMPMFDDANDQRLMHQAAGMVAAESGVDIPAALDLIRARAFADGQPATAIAAQVLSRRLHLLPGD